MGRIARNLQVGNGNAKPVRVVPDVMLEHREGRCYLMLGDQVPHLAVALDKGHIQHLIEALSRHAWRLEEREGDDDGQA